MVAIRIRDLECYLGPQLEMDGAERPRAAWRTLLGIAGLKVSIESSDDIQRTVAVTGHVLRGLSLEIDFGSVVCLTGASGSGKSVLLRILAGGMLPTRGSAEFYGPVRSLLEVGDNLDIHRTAFENVEAVKVEAGRAGEDVSRYGAEVFDFADLQGFEHAPLRTYSTGMLLRLSVGIALAGRPPIVLVDDVLAVGDIAFQQKCVDRMHALKQAGSTLLLASSDETLIQRLATRVVTLGGGLIISDTTPGHWHNLSATSGEADVEWQVVRSLPEDDVMALRALTLEVERRDAESYIEVSLVFDAKIGGLRCRPSVFLLRGRTVLYRTLFPEFVEIAGPRRLAFSVTMPTHVLPDGEYTLTIGMVTLEEQKVRSIKANGAVNLQVRRQGPTSLDPPATAAFVVHPSWEVDAVVVGAIP